MMTETPCTTPNIRRATIDNAVFAVTEPGAGHLDRFAKTYLTKRGAKILYAAAQQWADGMLTLSELRSRAASAIAAGY
jgi:hypothetical protein